MEETISMMKCMCLTIDDIASIQDDMWHMHKENCKLLEQEALKKHVKCSFTHEGPQEAILGYGVGRSTIGKDLRVRM